MKRSNNRQVLFTLIKAGLWGQEIRFSSMDNYDMSEIYRLAEEQSAEGLVAAGLERLVDYKVQKEDLPSFVGSVLQIEQRNKAMNNYIERLIGKLRKNIYVLLLKGQGIAQCYERPLWQLYGDIDLFLSHNNYEKAAKFLSLFASSIDEENKYNQHLAMTIDGWTVELHGTFKSGLWREIDQTLDKVQGAVFYEGKVRSWQNGKTLVFLPKADEDVVFVFSHILQHFFKEGIGLRQICDWCRLLWTYRSSLDLRLLESRIHEMGGMTEWKAFAALAVEYLGMPVDAIPFFSESNRWGKRPHGLWSSFWKRETLVIIGITAIMRGIHM